MEVTTKITGLKELERQLLKLEKKVSGKVLRNAARTALRPMQKAAKRNAPKSTTTYLRWTRKGSYPVWTKPGALRKSIRLSARLNKRGVGKTAVTAKVSAGSKDAFYAHMVERGTVKMPAQPFMMPAFAGHKRESLDLFSKDLKKRIDEVKRGRR